MCILLVGEANKKDTHIDRNFKGISTSIAFHENVSTKHIGFFRIFQMEKTSLHVMYAMFFPFETFIKNPTSFGNVFVKRYTRS